MTHPKLVRTAIAMSIAGLASTAQVHAQYEQDNATQEETAKVSSWPPERVIIKAKRTN